VTALHPNVPNPFNPVTRIAFDLARDGHVSLRIYDVGGRLVRTLIDAPMARGRYAGADAAVWDGIDDAGRRVSSGVYFYRLVTSDLDASRRMVLLK
jgi:flagellar hook assembly protein FlgD